jgi:iron complex transport system substrate-binding protein
LGHFQLADLMRSAVADAKLRKRRVDAAAAARQQKPSGFDALRATRANTVLINPEGMFPWDRYGTELPLQVVWAAQQCQPALFKHIGLIAKTIAFYRRFLAYDLKEQEAQRIIAGLAPI